MNDPEIDTGYIVTEYQKIVTPIFLVNKCKESASCDAFSLYLHKLHGYAIIDIGRA